jgi:hypothetical protein
MCFQGDDPKPAELIGYQIANELLNCLKDLAR